jgi:hypothetical protein
LTQINADFPREAQRWGFEICGYLC